MSWTAWRPRPPSRTNSRSGRRRCASRASCPGSRTLLVGDDPGSQSYVGGQAPRLARGRHRIDPRRPARGLPARRMCAPRSRDLNADPRVTGYIVQLPLPEGIDEHAMLELRRPGEGCRRPAPDEPRASSCSASTASSPRRCRARRAGIIELLQRYGCRLSGEHVVVVGRGVTVGRPIGLLLTRKGVDATVTLTHSRTDDLAAEVRRADVVVAAVGVPHLVKPEWVKPGAAVLDVGVTRVGTTESRQGEARRRRRSRRRRGRRMAVAEPGRGRPDDRGDAAVERGACGGARRRLAAPRDGPLTLSCPRSSTRWPCRPAARSASSSRTRCREPPRRPGCCSG